MCAPAAKAGISEVERDCRAPAISSLQAPKMVPGRLSRELIDMWVNGQLYTPSGAAPRSSDEPSSASLPFAASASTSKKFSTSDTSSSLTARIGVDGKSGGGASESLSDRLTGDGGGGVRSGSPAAYCFSGEVTGPKNTGGDDGISGMVDAACCDEDGAACGSIDDGTRSSRGRAPHAACEPNVASNIALT